MRVARRIITLVLLIQVAWSVPLAIVMAFVLPGAAIGFGIAALVILAVLLGFLLHWQRVDARRNALLATGQRAPALLVSSRATGTRINRRPVIAHTFESRAGGRVVRAVARAFVHLPIGAAGTLAYDPADPTKAVVVEDLDAVAAQGRLDWHELAARETDRRFREQS
jgi:hypothetical protein